MAEIITHHMAVLDHIPHRRIRPLVDIILVFMVVWVAELEVVWVADLAIICMEVVMDHMAVRDIWALDL